MELCLNSILEALHQYSTRRRSIMNDTRHEHQDYSGSFEKESIMINLCQLLTINSNMKDIRIAKD